MYGKTCQISPGKYMYICMCVRYKYKFTYIYVREDLSDQPRQETTRDGCDRQAGRGPEREAAVLRFLHREAV